MRTLIILFTLFLLSLFFVSCAKEQSRIELPKDCICIALYDPVCGVDGKTYSNSCVAGCGNVAIAKNGTCEEKNAMVSAVSA